MTSPILEEKGYFWWSDEVIPENHFAPESCITGALKIDGDGTATLELDATMPGQGGPIGAMFPPTPDPLVNQSITGLLRNGEHVLLVNLRRHGGRFRSNGISFSGYKAMECFVGQGGVLARYADLRVHQIRVDISEYHQWLRREPIRVEKSDTRVLAEYVRDPTRTYPLSDGTLSIEYSVSAPVPFVGGLSQITIKDVVRLVLTNGPSLSMPDARLRLGMLEDLFILLTDSDHCLAWPELAFAEDGPRYHYYFSRTRTEEEPPDWHKTWVSFNDVKDNLGQVFQAFCKKRDLFGPGVYMYLGLRRGLKLVIEHRFMNMVWGLEAFHRTQNAEAEATSSLKEKVDRILADVQLSKDKKWLARKLENAHEPSLAERLFDVLKGLPLDLDPDRLRAFCERCAGIRNDISHFGGRRDKCISYRDFMKTVMRASDALACLYHTLLLQEVGIKSERLKWWVYEGYRSYEYKTAFVDVELADEELIKPKPLAPPRPADPSQALPAPTQGDQKAQPDGSE